jgi:hypothetical protein
MLSVLILLVIMLSVVMLRFKYFFTIVVLNVMLSVLMLSFVM